MARTPESRPSIPSHVTAPESEPVVRRDPTVMDDRFLAEKVVSAINQLGRGSASIVRDPKSENFFVRVEDPAEEGVNPINGLVIFNEMYPAAVHLRDRMIKKGKNPEDIYDVVDSAIEMTASVLKATADHGRVQSALRGR